jgi:WD40 repeat protein
MSLDEKWLGGEFWSVSSIASVACVASDTYLLGIDFGTSATVASLRGPDGRVRSLLFDASPLLASAVLVGPGTMVLTGADAERAALSFPAGFEANPKRRIDDTSVWLGEHELQVTELIGAVLQRVATEAHRVAGQPPTDVVMTHPATWGRTRKSVLAEAAQRAGLGEVGLVPEPVAAAAYFASVLNRQIKPGRCLVVYDLGAGTFDVSVVRPLVAGFEVVASAGLDDVGGLDFDAAVVRHARSVTGSAAAQWGRLDWPQSPADQQSRHLLWLAARAAKEQLSRHAAADLTVPLVDTTLHITREEFEKAARPVLERTAALTLATLRESGIPREEIGAVFLVGGSSRIPLAATVLHRTLGLAPTVIDQPELVVAEGSLLSPVDPGRLPGRKAAVPAIPAVATPATNSHPVPSGTTATASTATASAATTPPPAVPDRIAPRSRDTTTAATATAAVAPRPNRSVLRRRRSSTARVVLAVGSVLAVVLLVGTPLFASILGRGRGSPTGTDPTPSISTGQSILAVPTLSSHELVSVLHGHTDTVRSVTFSPNGQLLASGSSDHTVRLWNPATGERVGQPLMGHTNWVWSVAFSPDGKLLASGAGGNGQQATDDYTVRLWNPATGQSVGKPLTGHTAWVWSVAFSPDGNLVASGSGDHTVRLWNPATGQSAGKPLTGHTAAVWSVAFSPEGNLLASGSGDNTVRLWNPVTGQSVGQPLTGHTDWVMSVAFSPDGKLLASGSADNTLRLWNPATGQSVGKPLTGHTDGILGVAFSPDGKLLASASEDDTVRLWNTATGESVGDPLTGHNAWVTSVAFSPDGALLASGGRDAAVRLWRVADYIGVQRRGG